MIQSYDFSNQDLPSLDHLDLTGCKILDVSNNKLTSLGVTKELPSTLKQLICSENQIKKIILPKSLRKLDCYMNQIEELILPDTLLELDCSDNMIEKLVLPPKLTILDCSENVLDEIVCNNVIKYLNAHDNPDLIKCNLPDSVENLNIENTKLQLMSFPFNLYTLTCDLDSILHCDLSTINVNKINGCDNYVQIQNMVINRMNEKMGVKPQTYKSVFDEYVKFCYDVDSEKFKESEKKFLNGTK